MMNFCLILRTLALLLTLATRPACVALAPTLPASRASCKATVRTAVAAAPVAAEASNVALSPGQWTVEIKDGEGLSAADKTSLSKDLAAGLTKRLQERLKEHHTELSGSGPKWVFTGEIARLPAMGNYVWMARLNREDGQSREIARQWVGTANSRRSLSFYRGTAHIDIDGLVGEMAQRVACAMLQYEANPGLRCLREMQAVSTEVTDQNSQRVLLQTTFAPSGSQPSQLIVKGQKAGKFWLIAVGNGEVALRAEPGYELKPGRQTSVPCTPGSENWVLLRVSRPVVKLQRDARGAQGDELVSILEMGPGYGDADTALLNLIDRMYREGSTLWYLKKVPMQSALTTP